MSKIMLIDAAYPEETRVALIDNKNRLIEYDFETSTKETTKGNIYLAKVMRVEPSLQAAFVEYGGNRHGFLAFSEIHPDYFRIPVSDREALNAQLNDRVIDDEVDIEEAPSEQTSPEETESQDDGITLDFENSVSTIAGDSVEPMDDMDIAKSKRPPLHRLYKIQEVIHKNQILLVQVVKEERGQKGAAITTYLSLAGRYSVLMPNSPHSGGISRKIASSEDRKRLRKILESLNIPDEMGLIIRTAGKDHTKVELKRDADYLTRLWEEIRQDTLKAIAPALIYHEDDIIKRAIRDLYTSDVNEIHIEGSDHYKAGREFMKKLMPTHVKKVNQFKSDQASVFVHYKVEKQIEAMQSPVVQLPSGGSIVLHPTEALVSIDINSGRSTRERNIESTALSTNLEAAVEIARQVRLRDLAGLIVIDFIDMDDRRHTQQVEKKIRDAFRDDRARVQMSKISPFGLLELSRQRLRPSIHETSSAPCTHCQATGYVRSVESMSLQILRIITEEGASNRSSKIKMQVPPQLAWYLLNDMRNALAQIEQRYKFSISIEADPELMIPNYRMIQVQRKLKNTADPSIEVIPINAKTIPQDPAKSDSKNPRSGERNPNRNRTNNKVKPKTDSSIHQENPPVVVVTSDDTIVQDIESKETVKKSTLRNRNNRRRFKERRNALLNTEAQNTASQDKPQDASASSNEVKATAIPLEDKKKNTKDAGTKPAVEVQDKDLTLPNPEAKETKSKRPAKSWLKRLLDTE